MLRATRPCAYQWGRSNSPQVLGASVPSFARYPHQAHRVLTLYRELWRVVMLHPPAEQLDLAVRLRNEFRRGRLITGTTQVNRAVVKAEDELHMFRQLVDTRASRFDGRCVALQSPSRAYLPVAKQQAAASGATGSASASRPRQQRTTIKAACVDGAWQELMSRAAGAVPNLPNIKRSRTFSKPFTSTMSANSLRF